MYEEAEQLVVELLPKALGIKVMTNVLYLQKGDLVSVFRGEEQEVTPTGRNVANVHILLKPGHYDILYPKEITKFDQWDIANNKWIGYSNRLETPKI